MIGKFAPNDARHWERKRLSGHFNDYVTDEVGGFIAPVGGIGEMAVYFPHFEHVNRVRTFEKVGQGPVIGILHLVLAGLSLGGMLQGNAGVFLN